MRPIRVLRPATLGDFVVDYLLAPLLLAAPLLLGLALVAGIAAVLVGTGFASPTGGCLFVGGFVISLSARLLLRHRRHTRA